MTYRPIVRSLQFVRSRRYEAGPRGYVVQRQLNSDRVSCQVIAIIPRKPGDHIKTNQYAARKLELLMRTLHWMSKLLLRHGVQFAGPQRAWGESIRRWLQRIDTLTTVIILGELHDPRWLPEHARPL